MTWWPATARRGLPAIGSAGSHRIDSAVTTAIAAFGGVLMVAVAPLVPAGRLMLASGLGALLVALWAWRTPVTAPMWVRHAYTAASLPVTVLGTAAAEHATDLRIGPVVLICPLLTIACLRGTRAVVGQLGLALLLYGGYLVATLPTAAAVVGVLAGGTSLSLVCLLVSMLRGSLDRLVAELRRQAERDPLTGLHNRHGLRVALAERPAGAASVVLIDLDHFKAVNDVHGHEAGDEVLQWFAGLLRTGVQAGDLAARLGGEEFVLVLAGTDLDAAAGRADRIRRQVQDGSAARTAPVTASMGVAAGTLADFSDLLRRADRALYRAKAAGRNRVERDGGGVERDSGGVERDSGGVERDDSMPARPVPARMTE